MFDSIGWAEILVLVVAGLFILGPERLPSAAAWLGRSLRQLREYATGAREQLRTQLGPDFDELRKPLEDLRSIRDLNPRRMVSRHLFDDENYRLSDLKKEFGLDDSDLKFDGKPNGSYSLPSSLYGLSPSIRPLQPGERPPIDPDAT